MNRAAIIIFCLCIGVLVRAQEKPLVVATASIFADMAENISGDLVDVRMIVPIGGDPHVYEPTPGDATLVAEADLVIKNGLTFEGWLNELIENSGTKAKVVTITEDIVPIQSEKYANSTDPHAWMDGKKGQQYLENIKKALADLDPDNADVYEINHGIYSQQLKDLDQEIEQKINSIPEKQRILITSHDAFRYYGERYGIRVEAILGTSTDAEAQTSDIIRLTKTINESGVRAVFVETTVNPKLLEQIAKDNEVKIGGKLFSDSIGDKESEAPTYLDMLKHNTETIVNALTGSEDLDQDQNSGEEKKSYGNFLLYGILILLFGGAFLVLVRKL